MSSHLFTIGHSTHSLKKFVEYLHRHDIKAVGDVRSRPYSQYSPQFNRELLSEALKSEGILYVFMGKELGGRPTNKDFFKKGRAQYEQIVHTKLFQCGVDRLHEGVKKYSIAIMCTEKDPITCHRMILICRYLRSDNLKIFHILDDGSLESNESAESRLLKDVGLTHEDLFLSRSQLLEHAYIIQGAKIAYSKKTEQELSKTGTRYA